MLGRGDEPGAGAGRFLDIFFPDDTLLFTPRSDPGQRREAQRSSARVTQPGPGRQAGQSAETIIRDEIIQRLRV